jgi:peptidoglycan/LPS O-acetylase OafA/YrhL
MTSEKSAPRYFFSLDAIRGLAALIVVFCHWQFFCYKDFAVADVPMAQMPLPAYRYLSIIYTQAPFAVDLFFLLSGFIFFWFYADKIANRETNFSHFFTYRFTRLYPVHLVTLIAIAFLQFAMIRAMGHPFIVQNNDPWHFVLNLLVIQTWGFDSTPAFSGFNAPSWSVSVEFFLYLLFFIVSYARLQHRKGFLLGIIVMAAIIQAFYPMLGQGIYSFYLGALLFHLYNWLSKRPNALQLTNVVAVIALLLWTLGVTEYFFSYIRQAAMHFMHVLIPGKTDAFDTRLFDLARNTYVRTFISPATVLLLAMLETTRGSLRVKWMQQLGNISYALYLVHFPLMVLFALTTKISGIDKSVFLSPATMLLFYAILIPLATLMHYYFELPIQQFFRKRLSAPKPTPVPVTSTT